MTVRYLRSTKENASRARPPSSGLPSVIVKSCPPLTERTAGRHCNSRPPLTEQPSGRQLSATTERTAGRHCNSRPPQSGLPDVIATLGHHRAVCRSSLQLSATTGRTAGPYCNSRPPLTEQPSGRQLSPTTERTAGPHCNSRPLQSGLPNLTVTLGHHRAKHGGLCHECTVLTGYCGFA